MLYIGIDCGTQGTKAVIFDSDTGNIRGKGYCSHQLIAKEDGSREQEPGWWLEATSGAIRKAVEKAGIDGKDIESLAVSGQQHGLVLLDEDGKPLRTAKLWNDTSTAKDNDDIIEEAGGLQAVWEKIGTALPVGYTASKVRYVSTREKELYSKVRHVLIPHDYINYWLTGEFATESSEASGTGYYSVLERRYSPEMMELIDPTGILAASVPEIRPWEQPIGYLRKDVAEELGLRAGIPVAGGGGDNTMSAIGTAVFLPDSCTLSLGTSGTVCLKSSKVLGAIDPLLQLYSVLDGQLLATCCSLNATNASTTIQELFKLSTKDFDVAMGKAEIGSGGVIAAQFFGGERIPPLPRADCFFKHLTTLNCTEENIIRATAEAVVFTLKWGFDKMVKSFGEPGSIVITGGGGNSAPWRKIVADVFNKEVRSLASDEGGALGAAIQAMYLVESLNGGKESLEDLSSKYVLFDDSKLVCPDERNHERYNEVFGAWKQAIADEWKIEM